MDLRSIQNISHNVKKQFMVFLFFHCVKTWCAKTFVTCFVQFLLLLCWCLLFHSYSLPVYSKLMNACSLKESFCQTSSKSVLPFSSSSSDSSFTSLIYECLSHISFYHRQIPINHDYWNNKPYNKLSHYNFICH